MKITDSVLAFYRNIYPLLSPRSQWCCTNISFLKNVYLCATFKTKFFLGWEIHIVLSWSKVNLFSCTITMHNMSTDVHSDNEELQKRNSLIYPAWRTQILDTTIKFILNVGELRIRLSLCWGPWLLFTFVFYVLHHRLVSLYMVSKCLRCFLLHF